MSLNRSSYVLYGALTSLSLVATACGDSGSQTNAGPSGVAPETNGVGNGSSNNNHDGSSSPPVTSGTVAPSASGFLHVSGSQLLDDLGHSARLTGVNWFGFETSNLSPHGLWARDYRSMLKQIHDLGFNSVRIPWCNAMLRPDAKASSVNTYGADPYDGVDPMNEPLLGKTPLEMMDLVIEAAGELNLKIILDNHSRKPDGYMEERYGTARWSRKRNGSPTGFSWQSTIAATVP